MAGRIRTLKPDFFTDADLAEVSPLHRLLFQGLWCHADRDGLLEDKPKEIKVKVLPFDSCDVDAMLNDLAAGGFVLRYQVGGRRFIAIPGFSKHQRFHRDEKPVGFPPPPGTTLSPAAGATRVTESATPNPRSTTHDLVSGSVLDTDKDTDTGLRAAGVTPDLCDSDAPTVVVIPKRMPPSPAVLAHADGPTLVDRMGDAFRHERGGEYAPVRGDEVAMGKLLTLAKSEQAEILRRWKIALRCSYPACNSWVDLARNWNAYAKAQERPAIGPGAPRYDKPRI